MKVVFIVGIFTSALVLVAGSSSQNGKNQVNAQKLVQDAIKVRPLNINRFQIRDS